MYLRAGSIKIIALLFLAGMFLTGDALAQDRVVDASCFHCHTRQVTQFEKSVHFNNNISCTDCHGGDIRINGSVVSIDVMSKDFAGSPSRVNLTTFCSKCHEQVTRKYEKSIHWKKVQEGRPQAASCIDCHGTHNILSSKNQASPTHLENIPLMCGGCHENQTKMQAWYYGIKTDRFDTYKKSYHYKSYLGGGKVLATCSDCHENHDTKPEADPESAINPANLPTTCGKTNCHPGANNVYVYGGKIHEEQSVNLFFIDVKTLVTYFYIIMILFELAFTFGLIFLGITSGLDIKGRKNHD
ncbi:MAG: NapC/NirT family cytochrome c [Candidatus Methanoperedens sp.]|nr:NapC/NirT family cytochrome c [Candidatus Methanoperedens sp.]